MHFGYKCLAFADHGSDREVFEFLLSSWFFVASDSSFSILKITFLGSGVGNLVSSSFDDDDFKGPFKIFEFVVTFLSSSDGYSLFCKCRESDFSFSPVKMDFPGIDGDIDV